MLARARRTIKKLGEENQSRALRTCKRRGLTLKLVHRITRDTVTQRLDLIRIRLLRLQLAELHKIKAILENKIRQQEDERRQLDERRERDYLKELDSQRQIEELRRQIEAPKEHQRQLETAQQQSVSPQVRAADSTFLMQNSEDPENLSPSVYNTPDEEKTGKESRFSTIDEEDDLMPPSKTPQRSYPRQSIGQWSVERARNNLSVRSLVSTLEDKTGAKAFTRSRLPRK